MFIEIVDFMGETKRFAHKPLAFFLYWRGVYATLFHPVEWNPLVQCITSNVFAFIGETPQYDDITLLVVRRKS